MVGQIDRSEALRTPTEEQATLALGTEVSNPVRVPAWRDEVAPALKRQQIDRGAPWLAGLASTYFQHQEAQRFSPMRVNAATARLNTCVVNHPGRW